MQRRTVETIKASEHVSKKAEVTYLSRSKDYPPSSPDCSDYEDDFEPLDEMESSITGPSAEISNDGEAPDVEYNCPEESSESLDEESSKSLDKDKQTNKDEQVPDDEYNCSEESSESLDEESSKSLDEEDDEFNCSEESSECLDEEKPTAEIRNNGQVPDDEFNCSEESSECLDEESPECPDEEEPTVDIKNRDQVPYDAYSYPEERSEYLDEDRPTAKIGSKHYVSNDGHVPGRRPQTKHRQVDDGRKIKRETTDSGPHLWRSLSEPSQSKSRDVNFKNYVRGRQSYDFGIREENIIPIGELSEEKNPQMGVGTELRRFSSWRSQTKHRQVDDGRKIKRETTDSGPHLWRSLSEPSQSKSRDVNFKNYVRGRQSYDFGIREENIIPIGELSEEKNPQMGVGTELRRFSSCTDIKLFDDYYVVSVNNKIIKYSLDSDQQLDQLTVPGAGRMCYIRRSSRIAVLQTPRGVICLETKPSLSVVYSIRASSIQYMSICHLDSFQRAVNERNGLPNPVHTFAATATSRLSESGLMDEYIYIIQPEYDRHQTNNCYNERSTRQNIQGLSGICSVHAFLKEEELCVIVGCKDRVCCVSFADKSTKWTIPLDYSATDVQFSDPYVLVCVQDECRLFVCDYKDGKIVIDNFLNRDDKSGRYPHKLSVYKNNVLVKFYNNNYWSCVADLKSSISALETTRLGFSLHTTRFSKPV